MEHLCFTDKENYCYISLIFDVNRGGVADIAEKILLFLDYESLKQFKKTCKSVRHFITNSEIELVLFERLPKPLSGYLKMTADWNYFNHNLCDELTRLRPKLSFAHGAGDYGYYVYANPRKHEVIPSSENEEEFEDTSDQITWEEFLEKHSRYSDNPDLEEWREAEYMIGKTPSEAFWNNCIHLEY